MFKFYRCMELKTCSRCGHPKPVGPKGDFYERKKYTETYQSICKDCSKKAALSWWHQNQERAKASAKKRLPRLRRQKLKYQRRHYREQKMQVFVHYSKGTPICACPGCKEQTLEFLSIDHINGGGRKHRKTFKGSIYPVLIKLGFPPGYRVLCHNCNMAYGFFGYCPHQTGTKFLGNVEGLDGEGI